MTIATAFQSGTHRVNRLRSVPIFCFLVHLGFALPLALLAWSMLSPDLLRSMESRRLLANFSPDWAVEFLYRTNSVPVSAIGAVLAGTAFFYCIVSTFLAGAALGFYRTEGRESFFACGARFYPRMLGVSLLSLFLYGGVFLLNSLLSAPLRSLNEGMEERPIVIAHWAIMLVAAFAWMLATMIADYARINVVHENCGVLRGFLRSLGFVRANKFATVGLALLLNLVGVGFLLAYHGATELITQTSLGAVILVFGIRQFYIFLRLWLRLLFWSSQLKLRFLLGGA